MHRAMLEADDGLSMSLLPNADMIICSDDNDDLQTASMKLEIEWWSGALS